MPQNYAVRISYSYDEAARVVSYIAQHSDQVAVVEHLKDANVTRTHIHLAVYGCNITAEAIRDYSKKHFKIDLAGNKNSSFKSNFKIKSTKEVVPMLLENKAKFLTYMSKGKYDPKYIKEITPEEWSHAKEQWVTFERTPKANANLELWHEYCKSLDEETVQGFKHYELGYARLFNNTQEFIVRKFQILFTAERKLQKSLILTAMYNFELSYKQVEKKMYYF